MGMKNLWIRIWRIINISFVLVSIIATTKTGCKSTNKLRQITSLLRDLTSSKAKLLHPLKKKQSVSIIGKESWKTDIKGSIIPKPEPTEPPKASHVNSFFVSTSCFGGLVLLFMKLRHMGIHRSIRNKSQNT